MKLTIGFLSLLLVAVYVRSDFEDDRYRYRFIYHENHDLLLTIRKDLEGNPEKCYFTTVDDKAQEFFGNCHKTYMEEEIVQRIEEGIHATNTTLGLMRDKYADLLASFHCISSEIYSLPFDFTTYTTICSLGLDAPVVGK